MAHIKSWKVLRKSCWAALIAPMNWEGDLHGSPWPWISCFILFLKKISPQVFCFSEDLCLCTLKSLFPVLSHGKGEDRQKSEWRRRKSSLQRQRWIEGNGKKCVFSQMKFGGTWLATFIILTTWKAATAALWTSWSILYGRGSDETALQCRAGLLFLSVHERKQSCQHGYNGHILILIFLTLVSLVSFLYLTSSVLFF